MKISECQQILAASLSSTRIAAAESSVLWRVARRVYGMASAYESDGLTFSASGDPVNALAGFLYGLGWLHFGYSYGVLIRTGGASCPFGGSPEILPAKYRGQLEEKTRRYCRLLDTARSSVTVGPDPETASFAFSGQVLCIAGAYARQGRIFMDCGKFEDALACFSYGHGWLDAAVIAGLLRITAERELFTI
ncbi:MAG TPA: DUF357 domain-containing protein [Methanoregula sp.]|nr:DUF357 domain-containing protein [Methanoregula sp.]